MKLEGQTALVTGASRGIGQSIAMTLAKAGVYVLGTATSEQGVESIKKNLADHGLEGSAYVLNVADESSVAAFADALKADGHSPSILVNNAGITKDNLLIRMKDDEWDDVINTNLNAIYRITKMCLRGMMKARQGRIINITSVVAMSGNPGQTNYAASKAGMIGFTRSLAREVGSRGITVNAVAPGFIETDMTDALDVEQKDSLLKQIALNRLGKVNEIAEVVKFLASNDAAYITGETINVNGGMYMG
ncbi:MAG: 3-oxoacyl-[acyl-carrier protein] reductase [Gammaproteobacteria bacterium]|jgi:3-oxoacyl-[acyl-carrier protein] reductase